MRHQGKVFDKTASFSFWRVAGTEHTPLTGLERTWTTNFSCLLKLRRDTSHHAERTDVTQPTKDMGNSSPLHLETLKRPVSGRDRADETSGYVVALELHRVECIELGSPRRFLQYFVDRRLEVRVEGLEEIFEQKSKKLTGQFQTFVPDIVPVVYHFLVGQAHENAPCHRRNKDRLWSEI